MHINSNIQKISPILNSFPPCLIIFVGSFCIEIFFGSKSQQTLKRNHKSRNGITEMKPVCLISHIYIHAHTHSQETITLNKIIINYIVIVCLFLKNMLKYCIEILTCPFSPCNLDGKYTKSMYNYVPVLNIFTIYIINVHQYFFQHLFKYIQ